jgi:hypothetical protein
LDVGPSPSKKRWTAGRGRDYGIEERSDLLAADVERVSDLCGTERAIAQGGEDIKLHSREHRERGKYRHP